MTDWHIERLAKSHDRRRFHCGNSVLDEWLKKYASQFDRRDLARTYVAVRPGEADVLGYYAISSHRVSYEALPDDQTKGLPRIDVPVVLLGTLAVDRSVQGQGLGSELMIDVLRRADHVAQQMGIRAVEVDAIDDAARQFYLHFGSVPLEDDKRHLFLPRSILGKLNLPPLR
jgi:GNAT superfamily N-acetyltransferase